MMIVFASGMSSPFSTIVVRDQDVVLVPHELEHGLLEFRLAHLPVAYADPRSGDKLLQIRRALPDRIHPVVEEVNLPAAAQFQLQRRPDQLWLEMRHRGLNRKPVLGRRLDHRHVAQPQQRHVQRTRDGRGAHGDHVHALAHLLQPLLVLHAKALFLVHDHQSQVFEHHIGRQQPVRAHRQVHLAFRQVSQRRLLSLSVSGTGSASRCGSETAETAA